MEFVLAALVLAGIVALVIIAPLRSAEEQFSWAAHTRRILDALASAA